MNCMNKKLRDASFTLTICKWNAKQSDNSVPAQKIASPMELEPAILIRSHNNCCPVESMPGQPLAAAVTERLIFPLHSSYTTGTDGKAHRVFSAAVCVDELHPHGGAIGILFHVRGHLKQAVRRFAKSIAEALQNINVGSGYTADNIAEAVG